MRYLRMNGAGNAFAIFDARAGRFEPTPEQIRAIAAESGADQIIAIEAPHEAGRAAHLSFWNADGGVTGACGNGTRAATWLLLEEAGSDALTVDAPPGPIGAARAGPLRVTLDMGRPRLDWRDIPLAERMDTRGIDLKVGPIDNPNLRLPGAVSMGNPHVVFFVDDAETAPVREVGPMIEHHPLFPERTNVGFAQILAPDRIRLRVWERGTGETLACGTGACAALVAAHRRRLTGRTATIVANGGGLHVEWREADDHVLLTGPVAFDGEGDFPL
jgi:diaminopimelate epimerase